MSLRRSLQLALDISAGLGVVVIFGVIMAQVGAREWLGRSLPWSEEVAGIALVWATLFGAAGALAREPFMALTLLEWTPARVRLVAEVLAAAASILFLGIVAWSGLEQWLIVPSHGKTTVARIPMAWVYGMFAVSSAVMILTMIGALARRFLRQGER